MDSSLYITVLLASVLAVNSQTQRGICFSDAECAGTATQSGLVDDLGEFCCLYSSPGVTTGISYQFFGIEQCFTCPKIIGFFEQDFRGEERANPHALTLGILSGPPLPASFFGSLTATASISSGLNSASYADFALTQTTVGVYGGVTSIEYYVQHQVDGVAQEKDEQYTIQLSNNFGFDNYTFKSIDIIIVDSDIVKFFFSETCHSKSENSDLILIVPYKKIFRKILANPVTFNIFPITIKEAQRRGLAIPQEALLENDPRSPYEAVEADFNPMSFNIIFPPDEGKSPITSIEVRVRIVDDDIVERFEQLFLIGAEVVDAVNLSAIDNTMRNMTVGIIEDNDDLVIGFVQSLYNFDEPDAITNQSIYLVRQDDKPTEQTYDVQINFIHNIPEATKSVDFTIDFFTNSDYRQIKPDEKYIKIQLSLFSDEIAEGNEQFILESSPVNEPKYSIAQNGSRVFRSTTVVIKDNDHKTVGYEEPVYSLNENSSTMICINVTNPPLEEPLITTSVLLTGPSILITAGTTDYSPFRLFFFITSSPANIPLARRRCVTISAIEDGVLEEVEEVEFGLFNLRLSTDYIVLQPKRTMLKIFDQSFVTVGFIGAPYSVIESDGMASLTIGLIQGQLAVPVTLNVQLVDVSAQASGDYLSTLSSSTVTLDESTSNVTITFPIVNDNIFELMESLSASLSLAQSGGYYSRVTVAPATAVVSIADDDVVTVGFIGAPYSVIESDGMASLTIGLIQGQLAVPVSLNVLLVDGSAQASGDYLSTLSSSTVTLDGATSNVTITFPIVNDHILELLESLSASLSLAQSGGNYSRVTVAPVTAVVSIADDDVVTVGFIGAPYSVIESDGMASLTIGLIQGQLAVPVSLNVQLVDGSARASVDYVTSSTSVTLDRVSSNAIVIFSIVNDSAIELSEKFFGVLSLVQSGGYYSRVTVDPAATIITIEDDDGTSLTEWGNCYKQENCQGSNTSSGLVGNLTSYCCDYQSPGVTNGYSYQYNGVKQCFSCPKVFGFFKRFRGRESAASYSLQLGYLSGPPAFAGDALLYVTATTGSGPTDASTSDFILKQNYVPLYSGQTSASIMVEHVVDGVTEREETYSLQIMSLLGLSDYSLVGTTVTIFDE